MLRLIIESNELDNTWKTKVFFYGRALANCRYRAISRTVDVKICRKVIIPLIENESPVNTLG